MNVYLQILCTAYAGVMIVVLVGLCVSISGGDILNPSLFFLAFITASFVIAGLIHPYEFFCLTHGILYFVCIPAGYLILMIYSLCNMHVVSWGTREVITHYFCVPVTIVYMIQKFWPRSSLGFCHHDKCTTEQIHWNR
jgi:hypothetical protein